MKKKILKNALIILLLIILIIPYNYVYKYYAVRFSTFSYVAVIIYAFLCGTSLMLMDLSNRRVNIVITLFYLIFSIINIQHSFFTYGPTVFLQVLMVGALFISIFKREKWVK